MVQIDNVNPIGGVTATSTGKRWNFCPECGTKLDPTWKHCPGCGQAIVEIVWRPNHERGRYRLPPMPYWLPTVIPVQPNTASPMPPNPTIYCGTTSSIR